MAKMTAHEAILVKDGIEPDAYGTGAENGAVIDTKEFAEMLVAVHVGDMGASATLDVKVQHGDKADASDMADFKADGTNVTKIAQKKQADGDDNAVYVGRVDLENAKGLKRYVRVVATIGTQSIDFSVLILLAAAKIFPVSQDNAVEFNAN